MARYKFKKKARKLSPLLRAAIKQAQATQHVHAVSSFTLSLTPVQKRHRQAWQDAGQLCIMSESRADKERARRKLEGMLGEREAAREAARQLSAENLRLARLRDRALDMNRAWGEYM